MKGTRMEHLCLHPLANVFQILQRTAAQRFQVYSFNLRSEEGYCKSEYWPTCGGEIKDDQIDKVDVEGIWHFLNCQEVYISYLNTSVFCGTGGRRIGKVSRKVGLGTFSQEVSNRCNKCEPEIFQWSPWTSVNKRSLRWRLERKQKCNKHISGRRKIWYV